LNIRNSASWLSIGARRFIPAAIVLAVALLYVAPALGPGRVLCPVDLPRDLDAWKPDPTTRFRVSNSLLSDDVVQFVVWDSEVRRMFDEGLFPWTNRFAGEGAPLFANPQVALLSPLTWPRLTFGLSGWALTAILKLLAGALGAAWLAREMGAGDDDAVVSGVLYAVSGFSVVWLLYPHTNVFALLPALAAAALRHLRRADRMSAFQLIALAALATVGGHPETLFIGVMTIGILVVAESRGIPERRRRLISVSVAALLGFLVAAVQMLPFAGILLSSGAAASRPSTFHGFRLWAPVTQILPGIFGSPLKHELDLTLLGVGDNFTQRAATYIGAIPLVCLFVAWRHLGPRLRRALVIAAAALLISWSPPGISWLFAHLPLFRVTAIEYVGVAFVLLATAVGGPALRIAAAQPRRTAGAMLIAAGALLVVAGVIPSLEAARPALIRAARSGITLLQSRGHLHQTSAVYEQRLSHYLDAGSWTALRRVAMPGACWIAAGIALSIRWRRRDGLLLGAALGEMLAFGLGFNPAVSRSEAAPVPKVVNVLRSADPQRQWLFASNVEVFPANLGTLYRVRDVVSYDVLESNGRVSQLRAAGYDPLLHTLPLSLDRSQTAALARLGVRYVLSRGEVAGSRRIDSPASPEVGVYEIGGAVPHPLPANEPPRGFGAGLAISVTALALSAVWIWKQRATTVGQAPD
jgi:hypothetical protein